MRGEYIDEHENVLLLGNAGTGKTHLATALGFAACAQGRRVRFFGVTSLVTRMLEQRDNHDLQRFMKQLERLEILGSERLTGALLDRLAHRVHILQANGESFRLRDARRRQRRRTKQ